MMVDLLIGLVLIVYVLSAICTNVLTKELFFDVASSAIPELSADFRAYAQHKPKLILSVLFLSILPGLNLIVAYCLYTQYDAIRDAMIDEFMKKPEWEKIRTQYLEVLQHESD